MDVRVTENREVGDASEIQSQDDDKNAISTVTSKTVNYQVMGTKRGFRWVWRDSEIFPQKEN